MNPVRARVELAVRIVYQTDADWLVVVENGGMLIAVEHTSSIEDVIHIVGDAITRLVRP